MVHLVEIDRKTKTWFSVNGIETLEYRVYVVETIKCSVYIV